TLFERALALDPSSVEAQSRLANYLRNRAMSKDAEAARADLERAEQLIAQALATSPGDPYAHFVKGSLLRSTRRCEEAIPEFEITLAANRNFPAALNEQSIWQVPERRLGSRGDRAYQAGDPAQPSRPKHM